MAVEHPEMADQGERSGDNDSVLDRLSVYTIRLLAADMVDKAGSGHLGAPFGCAPLANALWGKIMRFSPRKRWMNRDRFVLSVGHASALQYVMLHLTGNGIGGPYEVSMDQLMQFRQAGSGTPGHPEFRMTSGVEVTTGPLGQGFANGVGMAIAEAHLSARFNREGYPLFDHYTYILAGDGCMMEGVTSEAASLAGHLKLHKLIVFYDDNQTTIDGKTDLAFTEDVGARFAAYHWNVLHIEDGNSYDAAVYERAVREAKSQSEKPTLVIMKTTIGCGAGKGLEGTSKAHGGAFSNVDKLREKWFSPKGLRRDCDTIDAQVASLVQRDLDGLALSVADGTGSEERVLPKFYVPQPVLKKFRDFGARGDSMADEWEGMLLRFYAEFKDKEPDIVQDLSERMQGKYLTEDWQKSVTEYLRVHQEALNSSLRTLLNDEETVDAQSMREKFRARKKPINAGNQGGSFYMDDGDESLPGTNSTVEPATKRLKTSIPFKYKAGRGYVTDILKSFVEMNPSIIGGSADVASSCGGHFPTIQGNFLPPSKSVGLPGPPGYAGRYIHFGVREHACLAILNGISSYACLIPYSTLFTVFYQYGLPAVRMASISKFPVLYIGTHDSIDLGEDGPTHQPVEVLPQLRAMPNLLVIRPANVEEIVGAFQVFAEQYTQRRRIHQYVDPKPLVRRPVFIMTSRGELGLPYKSNSGVQGTEGVQRGAYVVHECFDEPADGSGKARPLPDIILIGSGQDVGLVMKTKEILLQMSTKFNEQLEAALVGFPTAASTVKPTRLKVRIVSMPCWELFDEQDQEYQDSVLLSNFHDVLRIYVEKAATKNTGHDKYAHFSVLMPSYGLSGKAADVERKLEFTPDYIASKVWSRWVDRGRTLQEAGDEADRGLSTWVSHLTRRAGSH
uniref:Transketolase-like pyrimidine-binding domain-containing protein n=1 Tax=Pyrodinium bahamense TaxID=73915 RepID=A0A7S0FDH9_9DINO|mmetsp:Transcript_23373/g.64742  ORF Transcript_23373/g.64742 Transcript_23373/m.64742 type:complete len:902 (+) Transcript_23373:21-2726(+)